MNDTERSAAGSVDFPHDGTEDRDNANESGECAANATAVREIGGRKGLDPVRYGDWEKDGRCIDF